MNADALLAVFADFNESRLEPPAPPPVPPEPPPDLERIRQEAWTDGYLAACRCVGGPDPDDRLLPARLLSGLHAMEAQADERVDSAARAVADLLVSAVTAVTVAAWAEDLPARVRRLAARIRPSLTVAPEFVLRDVHGIEHCFADIAGLERALEGGAEGMVAMRWAGGEASIDREALLDSVRAAMRPLATDTLTDEPDGRLAA